MITIGVDIGSTSIKGVLFDVTSGTLLHTASAELHTRVITSDPAHYEEDPAKLRHAAFEVIRALTAAARQEHVNVESIAFTGQMHGGLVVDHDLNALTNCITWQDKRGDERLATGVALVEELRDSLGSDVQQSLGTDIHTGFLGVSVAWLLRKGFFPAGGVTIIGIYDWIASLLVGEAITDPASAAAWGVYSIRDKQVDKELLRVFGITEAMLPRIVECGTPAGVLRADIATQLGLQTPVTLVAGTGDTQASYIGSGCQPIELLLNFGTGSQLMFEGNTYAIYPGTDLRYLPGGKFLHVASTLAGGKAYSVLASFYADVIRSFTGQAIAPDELYARMNESALDESPLRFTPYFNGSRTHGESLRASISGIDRDNLTAANMTRALLDGMVEELQSIYDRVPEVERRHIRIVGSGNGFRRNPALREVIRSRFGTSLRTSPFEEEAAVGAAMIAGRSLS